MPRMTPYTIVLSGLLASTAPLPACADDLDVSYGGKLETKFQADGRAGRGQKGSTELFNKTEAEAYINLGEIFSIHAASTYERLRTNVKTAAFNNLGLYLDQLYVQADLGRVSLYAGKIHPKFSVGYDLFPGIYDSFANDYEQKERNGLGVQIDLAPAWGRHVLSAETYFLDTTFLSQALFTTPQAGDPLTLRPGKFARGQGGAGNTGRLNNFDAALDGSDIPVAPGLAYHLGVSHQARGLLGERNETGITGALSYEIPLTSRVTLTPLVEIANFTNFGGNPGERRDYLITAVTLETGPWAVSVGAGQRRVKFSGATTWDSELTATASYAISSDLTASLGYLRLREAGSVTNIFGAALAYALKF